MIAAKKGFCINGHEKIGDNLVIIRGRRKCRICIENPQAEKPDRSKIPVKQFCKHGHEFTQENTYVFINRRNYKERACRECQRQRQETEHARELKRQFDRRNKEKKKEYNKKNFDKRAIQKRAYYEKRRDYLKKYGISIEEYNRLRAIQDYRCRICEKHESELHIALVVDHCHKTNIIRALLCSACNVGIGNLGDDPRIVQKALEYLNCFRDLGVD